MPNTNPINTANQSRVFRVLIDTNVLVSYLLVPNPQGTIPSIIIAAFESKYTLLISETLLTELAKTIRGREHLAKRIHPEQAEEFIGVLRAIAELLTEISEPIPSVTRDPKDDYLLAYALLGRADYLVTGDDDLLVLKEVEGVRIVRPAEFKVIFDNLEGLAR
jgi:putative PIN family toxin of toxin-antitoxin system